MSGRGYSPARSALILFRADATAEIGGGHVMRLLALADAHQRRGGRTPFALNRASEPLHGELVRRGHEVATIAALSGGADDIESTRALGRQHDAVAMVLDGSFAGLRYEQAVAGGAAAVVAIDDGDGRTSAADILVNPNAGAEQVDYVGERPIRLLRGPRYALLRHEFLGRGRRRRSTGPGRCLLISFGSSDPAGGTARVLRGLLGRSPLRVLVVLGAHHPHPEKVLETAEEAARGGHAVEVISSPPDMAQVMAAADAAITAAGGTLLELAHIGCPALAFVVADNQRRGCRSLVEAGCVAGGADLRQLADDELVCQIAGFLSDAAHRHQLAVRARRMVDGLGARRVLSTLEQYLSGTTRRTEATA